MLRSTPEVTSQKNVKSVTPHPDKARIWSRIKQKPATNSVVRTLTAFCGTVVFFSVEAQSNR